MPNKYLDYARELQDQAVQKTITPSITPVSSTVPTQERSFAQLSIPEKITKAITTKPKKEDMRTIMSGAGYMRNVDKMDFNPAPLTMDIGRGIYSAGLSLINAIPTGSKALIENVEAIRDNVLKDYPILKAVGSTARAVGRELSPDVIDPVVDMVTTEQGTSLAKRVSQVAMDAIQKEQSKVYNEATNKWAVIAGQASGNILSGIAVGLLTKNPQLATATMVAPAVAPFYEESRKKGYSPAEAVGITATMALPTYALEKIGLKYLTTEGLRSLLRSPIQAGIQAGKKIGVEAVQEVAEQGTQNVLEKLFLDKNKNILDDLLEAGVGGVFGGATGVGALKGIDLVKRSNAISGLRKQFQEGGMTRQQANEEAKKAVDMTTKLAQFIHDSYNIKGTEEEAPAYNQVRELQDIITKADTVRASLVEQGRMTPEADASLDQYKAIAQQQQEKLWAEVQRVREQTRSTPIVTDNAEVSVMKNPDGSYTTQYSVTTPNGTVSDDGTVNFRSDEEALYFGKKKVKDILSKASPESTQEIAQLDTQYNLWSSDRDAKPLSMFAEITDPDILSAIPESTERFALSEALYKIAQDYDTRVLGRNMRGVLGSFFRRSKALNIKGITNVSVFAHEMAHMAAEREDLAGRLTTKNDPIVKELVRAYDTYYPNKSGDMTTKVNEGFAVAFQKTIENQGDFKSRFGSLYNEMFSPSGKLYSETMSGLKKRFQTVVAQYQKQDRLDKNVSYLTKGTDLKKESIFAITDKTRMYLADEWWGIERMERDKGYTLSGNTPSIVMRAMEQIAPITLNNFTGEAKGKNMGGILALRNGEYKKVSDYNYKTLSVTLNERARKYKIPENTFFDWFNGWLVSRRLHEQYNRLAVVDKEIQDLSLQVDDTDPELVSLREERDALAKIIKNDGRTQEDVREGYEAGKGYFMDKSDGMSLEEMFDGLNRIDLDSLAEVGRITKEQAEELKGKKGYASFKRQKVDDFLSNEMKKYGDGGLSMLKKRKGSQAAIQYPLYSMLLNHQAVTRAVAQQHVRNVFGQFFELEYPEMFTKMPYQNTHDNDPSMLVYIDQEGKKASLAVEGEMLDILNAYFSPVMTSQAMKYLKKAKNMFTTSTTALYLPFAFANLPVDVMTGFTQTQADTVPVVDGARMVLNRLRDKMGTDMTPEQEQEMAYLSEYFTIFIPQHSLARLNSLNPDQAQAYISGEMNGLKTMDKVIQQTKTGARTALDWVTKLSSEAESFTRAAEYVNARKKGDSQFVAGEKAGRVTAPFHHKGSMFRNPAFALMQANPFFNASLQVGDQYLRTVFSKKSAKLVGQLALVLGVLQFAGVASIFSMGSEEQKRRFDKKTAEERAKYIYFWNANGDDPYKFRVSDTLAFVPTLFNMVIENALYNADWQQEDFVTTATEWIPQQLKPWEMEAWFTSLFPVIAKTFISVFANKKTFPTGAPIEPEYLQKLPKRLRSTAKTSWLAKAAGNDLFSPVQIDFMLEDVFGRSAKLFTKPDQLLSTMNPFVSYDYPYSGKYMERYFKEKEKLDAEVSAIKKKVSDLSEEKQAEVLARHEEFKQVEELRKELSDALTDKNEDLARTIESQLQSLLKTLL